MLKDAQKNYRTGENKYISKFQKQRQNAAL